MKKTIEDCSTCKSYPSGLNSEPCHGCHSDVWRNWTPKPKAKPTPEPTTADKLRAAADKMTAEQLFNGELKCLCNAERFGNKERMCLGVRPDIVLMHTGSFSSGAYTKTDEAFNRDYTFPIPPPEPKNSERVRVGQVWSLIDDGERTMVCVTSEDVCYQLGDDLHVCRRTDLDCEEWKLLREPKPRTLAELGLLKGVKIKRSNKTTVCEIESIAIRDPFGVTCTFDCFDELTIVPSD